MHLAFLLQLQQRMISFISARPTSLRSVYSCPSTVILKAAPDVGLLTFDVLADLANAPGRDFDFTLGITHLPADSMLVVLVGSAQPPEPRDVSFQSGLLHQPLIAGSDRPGHGELVGNAFADMLQAANRGVAGEGGGDESRLALIALPHGGVQRAFRGPKHDASAS